MFHINEMEKAPADFPRTNEPGGVSGVQVKLLVAATDSVFTNVVDEESIYRRWVICEDLVQQLAAKTIKRSKEGRIANLNNYVSRLQDWLEAQDWDGWRVTWLEARWMRDRIKQLVDEQVG